MDKKIKLLCKRLLVKELLSLCKENRCQTGDMKDEQQFPTQIEFYKVFEAIRVLEDEQNIVKIVNQNDNYFKHVYDGLEIVI